MTVNSVRHGFLCNNSGLSILLHGLISLPDATSYDTCKIIYHEFEDGIEKNLSRGSPFGITRVTVWHHEAR